MARKWTEEQLRDLVSGDMEGFETVTESSGSWRHGHMLTVITKDLATGELWRVKATVHHSEGIQEVLDPVPVEAVTVTETRYLTAAEREKVVTAPEPPEAIRDLFARVHDDYESVLTLVRAFLDAESDAERAEAVAELRVYALGPEEDEPVAVMGPGIPLGPPKPEPFAGETPVREWVVGREIPPAREVVAPARVVALTEVERARAEEREACAAILRQVMAEVEDVDDIQPRFDRRIRARGGR